MKNGVHFHRWTHEVGEAQQHVVFPDGCRDVLVVQHPGGIVQVLFTDFDDRPRLANLLAGTRVTGYRLRPGATVSACVLEAVSARHDQVEAILAEACGTLSELDEAIVALSSPGAMIGAVCRGLGVSPRTMQRHFLAQGLPSPDYWRLLARARRAAEWLSSSEPLAEIAAACGFSDQAHLTREPVRWFGLAPSQLRRQADVLERLRQPALGNWTGEQISTR